MLGVTDAPKVIGWVFTFLIGRNPFSNKTTKDQLAAYELFVALRDSVAVPLDPVDDRSLSAVIDALASLSDELKEIQNKHGLEASKSVGVGNQTSAEVAFAVRPIIDQRVTRWRNKPALAEAPANADILLPEVDNHVKECVSDLKEMHEEVAPYIAELPEIAGNISLSSSLPVPPSEPILVTQLTQPVKINGKPRQSMVRWLDPIELIRIAWSKRSGTRRQTSRLAQSASRSRSSRWPRKATTSAQLRKRMNCGSTM